MDSLCWSCGAHLPVNKNFCMKCGQGQGGPKYTALAQYPPQPQPQPGYPPQYLPGPATEFGTQYQPGPIVVDHHQHVIMVQPRTPRSCCCLGSMICITVMFFLIAVSMPIVIWQAFAFCISDPENWFKFINDPSAPCFYVPVMSCIMVVASVLTAIFTCISCCTACGYACSR